MKTITKIMILIQVFVALNCKTSCSSIEVNKADIQNLNNRSKIKFQPKSNRKTNLCNLKRESFFLGKNSFHTSSILYSGKNPQITNLENTQKESSNIDYFDKELQEIKDEVSKLDLQVESLLNQDRNLDCIPTSSENSKTLDSISTSSEKSKTLDSISSSLDNSNVMDDSLSEWDAFPWLRSHHIGLMIDPNYPLSVFDSVKILKVYLEKGLKIDPALINEGLLTKILEPFKNNPTITVKEFMDYIENLHNEDKEFIQKLIPSDSTDKVEFDSPLDKIDFYNMHELFSNCNKIDWQAIWNSVTITEISSADIAAKSVSYSLLLRGFVKYVHNRPYPQNISEAILLKLRRARRLQLLGFAFGGAPLIMYSTRFAAINLRDLFKYEFKSPIPNNKANSENSNLINSAVIFTMLTNFRNKKPFWFKFLVLLIIVILISFKIGGVSNFWFVYSNISITIVILYNLVNLYLLYLSEKQKTNIPFIFPEFIQNWLKKEFEELSQFSLEEKKYFKNEFYLYLTIFFALLSIELVILI